MYKCRLESVYRIPSSNSFPRCVSFQEWPKEFTLSDHRMIMTEFELETQENRQTDGQTSDQSDRSDCRTV